MLTREQILTMPGSELAEVSAKMMAKRQGYFDPSFDLTHNDSREVADWVCRKIPAASELTRIILRPTGSLRGLDKMFSAAFKNVCLDGIKRVGNVYRDRIGGKATLETSVGSREVPVVSADSTAVDQWGEEIDPISLRVEDSRAIEQFQDVIGHEAYKTIAPFLPPRQRAVLEMRVQNQEFKQIAMCLNIHPETASSDFEKAVQFIEAKLSERQREGR